MFIFVYFFTQTDSTRIHLFGVVLARFFFPQFSIVDSKTVQRSALCRSRRELSKAYLLAEFAKICRSKQAIPTPGHKSGSDDCFGVGDNVPAAPATEHRCAEIGSRR